MLTPKQQHSLERWAVDIGLRRDPHPPVPSCPIPEQNERFGEQPPG